MENMETYEIFTDCVKFKERSEVKEWCVLNSPDCSKNPEQVGTYYTLEEAREALDNFQTEVTFADGTYTVREWWIEENFYNKKGEKDTDGDAWNVSAMPKEYR